MKWEVSLYVISLIALQTIHVLLLKGPIYSLRNVGFG